VEKDREMTVGGDGGSGRKIICAAGIAGQLAEEFAVGHLRCGGNRLLRPENESRERHNKRGDNQQQ
jgi:hypothetical protein